MVGRAEEEPSQGPPQTKPPEVKIPRVPRPMPFVPGAFGKPPSQRSLVDFQEAPALRTADFTPLHPDIMNTIDINPT